MPITFHVTYDTWDEDALDAGETDDKGFYSRGGWKHDDPSEWTLQDVVREFGKHGLEDGGRSFYTVDEEIDYRTGERTNYAVHPPRTITRASYRRVARILSSRPKG